MRSLAATALAAFAAVALAAGPAGATAGMSCTALDDSDVVVDMNLSRAPGTAPNWVRVSVGGKVQSTLGLDEPAVQLTLRQSFDDGHLFAIDLDDGGEPAIEIRILQTTEGDKVLQVGYVHVLGHSVHPISCEEDE